jgi:hypothetical protein
MTQTGRYVADLTSYNHVLIDISSTAACYRIAGSTGVSPSRAWTSSYTAVGLVALVLFITGHPGRSAGSLPTSSCSDPSIHHRALSRHPCSSMLHHNHPLEPLTQGFLLRAAPSECASLSKKARPRRPSSFNAYPALKHTRHLHRYRLQIATASDRREVQIIDRQETICQRGMGLVHFYSMGADQPATSSNPTLPPTSLFPPWLSCHPATIQDWPSGD